MTTHVATTPWANQQLWHYATELRISRDQMLRNYRCDAYRGMILEHELEMMVTILGIEPCPTCDGMLYDHRCRRQCRHEGCRHRATMNQIYLVMGYAGASMEWPVRAFTNKRNAESFADQCNSECISLGVHRSQVIQAGAHVATGVHYQHRYDPAFAVGYNGTEYKVVDSIPVGFPDDFYNANTQDIIPQA